MRSCGCSVQCCLFSLGLVVKCLLPQDWPSMCSGKGIEFSVLLVDVVAAHGCDNAPHGGGVDGKVKALLVPSGNQV